MKDGTEIPPRDEWTVAREQLPDACKGTKVVPQLGGFMAQTPKKS
jgi:hypothetical protein